MSATPNDPLPTRDGTASSGDPASADGDHAPAAGDHAPAAGDDAPAAGDHAPAAGDPAPAAGEQPAAAPLPTPTRFVFIDTEATGLDHQRHELTEVAWIVRFEDGREQERQFFPQHTIDGADADALDITHYHERIAPQPKTPASEWLTLFLEDAEGAILVGAVPDFDARHLQLMCRKLGLEPTWDHHLLDVETLALPLLAPGPEAPRSLARTCAALGVPHDRDQAHGALYDAQQAMRAFDAVWELIAELRAAGAPLPPPVPRDNNNHRHDADARSGGAPSHSSTADHDPEVAPPTVG